jgi:hypothetical protein
MTEQPYEKSSRVEWLDRRKKSTKGVVLDFFYQSKVLTREEGWRYLIRLDVKENGSDWRYVEKYKHQIQPASY